MDAPSIELALRHSLERGDRRATATLLVTHYGDDVFAVCRAMLRDRALAEDLAQETFGRAFAQLATFRGESSLRTWLLSIARNACLDVLRRRRASPIDEGELEPDEHAAAAPAAIDQLVGRQDVERALAPLSENERAMVVLHYGHGVGYPELAQAFALREGSVRMRMSRAVEKMRAALAEPSLGARLGTMAAPAPMAAAPAPARARAAIPSAPGAAAPAPPMGPPPSSFGSGARVSPMRDALSAACRARIAALAAAA